jgi:predicted  nucleic acid-binding Zn-ribbon protein
MKRSDLRKMIVSEMKTMKEGKAYGKMPKKQADGIDKLNEAWDLFDEVEDALKDVDDVFGEVKRAKKAISKAKGSLEDAIREAEEVAEVMKKARIF